MRQRNKQRKYTPKSIARLYPLLYSQKRFDEWMSLFDERAMMVRVEKGEPISCMRIIDGITEQIEYGAENKLFLEKWHHVKITQNGNIAVLKANYILTTDKEIRKGVDILTLCCNEHGWLITNLTYEQNEIVTRLVKKKIKSSK
jgi:hypothetical protein